MSYFDPSLQLLDDLDELELVRFGLSSEQPLESIREHLHIVGVQSATVEPLSRDVNNPQTACTDANPAVLDSLSPEGPLKPAASANTNGTGQPAAPSPNRAATEIRQNSSDKDRPTETVRVDTERLDQLMNLAGQLVINKARFAQINETLKRELGISHSAEKLDALTQTLDKIADDTDADVDQQCLRVELEGLKTQVKRVNGDIKSLRADLESVARAHDSVSDLSEAVHQFDRISTEMQQSVMATRMVPIGPLFTRFKRVIRDIARADAKDIRLIIRGEKTELDKRLIDELSDPLTHLFAIPPIMALNPLKSRLAAGKPAEGTVILDALHRGNSIIIQVIDDGKGLDTDRILSKCLEKRLFTEADAAKMTPHQIWQMIWAPGFSTAEKVTEVSGRGMGMDIVRSKIANINGTVELDSVPGQSTTLTIKLPTTLAILPSLMVKIDQDSFAIPMESVKEIICVPAEEMVSIQGQTAVCVRNRVIIRKRLEELFTWHRRTSSENAEESGQLTLVIIGEPGHEMALAVDHVIGEEDVVIKSISENYKNVPGVAGATVLGDGRVSVILDVPTIIDTFSNRTGPSQAK